MTEIQKKINNFLDKSRVLRENATAYLAEEILNKRLIVFVGAGCSVDAGLPSWGDLISEIQKEIQLKTNETDLLRVASTIEKKMKVLPFREKIVEKLRTLPSSLPLHKKIVQLDVNLFITTNYDQLLKEAFRNEGIIPTTITRGQDIPSIAPTQKTIVKLHGDIDSPSSIVISSMDYRKYNLEHKNFVNWLNSKATENTILFIGTSFTDQRLKNADDFVLNRFGKFRRPPCIFLSPPQNKEDVSDEEYAVEFDDFEMLCEEFIDKGFKVIVIEDYAEIPHILEKINKLAFEKKIQESPEDLQSKLFLKTIHAENLEERLAEACDEKVRELCNNVWGNGKLPTQNVMQKHAEKLKDYLEKPQSNLNAESQLQGFLTLGDVYLNLEKKGNIKDAKIYLDKANVIFQGIKDQSVWQNRLTRVTAKLLFLEGKIDEAISSISGSSDEKTVAFWLTLLHDSEKFNEAYQFVSTNKICDSWRSHALYTLIVTGHINEAEKNIQEFIAKKPSDKDCVKVYESMADAYLRLAVKSTGKIDGTVYPEDIKNEGEDLCAKAIEYVDKISNRTDLENDYFAYLALTIKLKALYLLKEFHAADGIINDVIKVTPIWRDVAEYIVTRAEFMKRDIVEKVIQSLSQDYPDQSWALLLTAFLQMRALKDDITAWENAKKVLNLSCENEEKERAAGLIFDVGNKLEKQQESQEIINTHLPPDSLWRKYLEAGYEDLKGNSDKAFQMISKIEAKNPSPELYVVCKYMRALKAIKNDDYQKAEHLLVESQKTHLSPDVLLKLLEVQESLQNDAGAFETAEKLEVTGYSNTLVKHVKAQTSRNLGYFAKSEEAWGFLVKENPQKSELAYGYAEVLYLQEKHEDALSKLEKFIQDDEDLDFKCLRLAKHILSSNGQEKKAFKMLSVCFKRFQDNPDLLMGYFKLGNQIGGEEKNAHKALMRLEQLRQDGKVEKEDFGLISLDNIKEMIQERHEIREKLCKQYCRGKVLRHFFSSFLNLPLYLDWAYRTQPLPILPEGWANAEYTTYVTNGFRVEKNQLIPIVVPADTKEIVIDYTALITLHQLKLFPKFGSIFETIYYPSILDSIWREDKQKYKPIQASQKKICKDLKKKFDDNVIKVIALPELSQDTEIKLAMRLAGIENIPLISAYLEEKEISKESPIIVLRFQQLLTRLYEKGRLSESRYFELKRMTTAKEDIIKIGESDIFDDALRLAFDKTTLELAERFQLIEIIKDVGFQIVVERTVEQAIQWEVRAMEHSVEVGEFQRDMEATIKEVKRGENKNLFRSERTSLRDNALKKLHVYEILAVETSQMAVKKKLSLLTDDRFLQMQRMEKNSFGSDALIRHLFNAKVISIDEYAKAFLKLCEWRYRFLIPDTEIIVYFIQEYKNSPLGKPLEILIKYSNECMEDVGIFSGREAITHPTSCSVRFYMRWVQVWIEALIKIWVDSAFEETRGKITKEIFLRALPKGPQNLPPEVRTNIMAMTGGVIIDSLFIGMIGQRNPSRFKELFNQAFEHLGFSDEKQIDTVIYFLRNGILGNLEKKWQKVFILGTLEAFYGGLNGKDIHERFIPFLQEEEIEISRKRIKDTSQQDDLTPEIIQKISRALSGKPERRPLAVKSGPLIFIPSSKEKDGSLLVLHDLLGTDSKKTRKNVIDKLCDPKSKETIISEYTKKFIKEREDSVFSEKLFVWSPPAREIQDALLKDFFYAQYMFQPLGDQRISDASREDFFKIALQGALEPNIESVLSNLPFLLEDPFEKKAIEGRIKSNIQKYDDIEDFLSWYLENVYFVPYFSQKSIYELLKATIKDASSHDILEITQRWVLNVKEDHLALFLALEIILSARADVEEDKDPFKGIKFYKFLDDIFRKLLLSDKFQKKLDNPEMALMQSLWKSRMEFACYYLCYLDINMHDKFDDERKVALAWWMAKKTIFSILDAGKKLTLENKTAYIDRIIEKNQRNFSLMQFRYQFIKAKMTFTSSRYLTINKADLLSYAVCALFGDKGIEHNKALKGLRLPVDALAPEISKIIMNKLAEDIISGNSQLPDYSSTMNLRWNMSLCKSVPNFFKEYYGDALEFLGKKVGAKLENAEGVYSLAKNASTKVFLSEHLPNLFKYSTDNKHPDVVLVLSSLKVFLFSHKEKEYPKELQVFEKNPNILKEICQFKMPLVFFSCEAFLEILLFLQSKKIYNWTSVFCKQFENIDYLSCEDNILDLIISNLIIFVLIGGDKDVLNSVLKVRNEDNKKVRDILKKMKSAIESLSPYVPWNCRDNFRQILKDLF